MSNSLLDRMKKTTSVKTAEALDKSSFVKDNELCSTGYPIIDIALSGSVGKELGGSTDSGLGSGITILAGASKSYKSNLMLLMCGAYLKKHPDAIGVLFDCEYGITETYIKSAGIDPARILHIPVVSIEMLKFEMVKLLGEMGDKDRIFFMLDSAGAISSNKEVEDAKDEKMTTDMTRAKAMKSFARTVLPLLMSKGNAGSNAPFVAINSLYKEMGLFPKDVMTGGTGIYYAANTILFISRSQEKSGKEIVGYNFKLGADKSRYVREKSVCPLEISWEHGINKWSGLLDIALELGAVVKPSNGWFQGVSLDSGEILFDGSKYRRADTSNAEFWEPILKSGFALAIEERYKIPDISEMIDDIDEDEEPEE